MVRRTLPINTNKMQAVLYYSRKRRRAAIAALVLSPYAVLNLYEPPIVYDFYSDEGVHGTGYFRKGGVEVAFDDLLLHTAGIGTVTDSDGLQKHRAHNLFDNSEDMAAQSESGGTVNPNVAVDPLGDTTLDEFVENTATEEHRTQAAAPPVVGVQYTVAVVAKKGVGTRYVYFRGMGLGGDYPIFDVNTGAILNAGSQWLDTRITDIGGGLYLCEADGLATGTANIVVGMQANSGIGGGGAYSYLGDGVSSLIFGWFHYYRSDLGGMQDNPDNPDFPTYVPTTTDPVYKRRNHYVYAGGQWVGPRCLKEPDAATNLLTYSNEFFNPAWIKNGATIVADQSISPDGNTNMSALRAVSTSSAEKRVELAGTITSEGTFTGTAFIKAGNVSWCAFTVFDGLSAGVRRYVNLATGVIGSTDDFNSPTDPIFSVKDCGGGIYRIRATMTAGVITIATLRIQSADSDGGITYAAGSTSTDEIYIYGAQLEEGSVPSSYIPTSGAAVTRPAETLVIPAANLASVVNTNAMSISLIGLMDYADTNNLNEALNYRWRIDGSNGLVSINRTTAPDRWRLEQSFGGVFDEVSLSGAFSPNINEPFNIAARHGATFINGALDGVALTENATPTALADLSAEDFEVAPIGIHNIQVGTIHGVDITDEGIEQASSSTLLIDTTSLIDTTILY